MSRIAVVIPCHDDGALAVQAVASIDEAEEVEVVVVDDGSTEPETLAHLDALRRSGVIVERRPQGGQGAARRTGIESTAAPFVFMLDADDLLEPGALGHMADLLEAAPAASFVWGDYTVFGDHPGRYRSPARFLPWTLLYVNPYPVCALFRRTALTAASDDRPIAGYEDWDLWLRFVELGLDGLPAGRAVYRRRLHGPARSAASFRRDHRALYTELRARHAGLFGARAQLRRRERPALWKRAVYPVLFGHRAVVPHRVEAWLQRTMLRRGLRLSR